MKILTIGDIHANVEIIERIEELYPNHYYIFVGDYLDSYIYPPHMSVEALVKVLDIVESGRGDACYGNHELSYLVGGRMRCSGYKPFTDSILQPHKIRAKELLKYYIWLPSFKILITHAGLTKHLWDEWGMKPENIIETLEDWKSRPWTTSPNARIGHSRGGESSYGGIFWCDFIRGNEFVSTDEITQIFGHTPLQKVTQKGTAYAIDNFIQNMTEYRPSEVVEIDEDGKIQILQIPIKE